MSAGYAPTCRKYTGRFDLSVKSFRNWFHDCSRNCSNKGKSSIMVGPKLVRWGERGQSYLFGFMCILSFWSWEVKITIFFACKLSLKSQGIVRKSSVMVFYTKWLIMTLVFHINNPNLSWKFRFLFYQNLMNKWVG